MSCAASVCSVRDFMPEVDSLWLHSLWHRSMHGRWAISLPAMLNTLAGATMLMVADYEGRRSGFCAVNSGHGGSAGLTLLLVEPRQQRHGIGTELLKKAEGSLQELTIYKLALGAGDGDYFWPGLPQEQSAAWCFFRARGFIEDESTEDLIHDLDGYVAPGWVAQRLAKSGSMLQVADPSDLNKLSAFEQRHFPAWAAYFRNESDHGRCENILLAKDQDGNILGSLLIRHDLVSPWVTESGRQVGTLNTLGVVPSCQGKGIGMALTTRAMEVLRLRGCSHCLIQWTGLKEWYGKLGTRTWAHYSMASKSLPPDYA